MASAGWHSEQNDLHRIASSGTPNKRTTLMHATDIASSSKHFLDKEDMRGQQTVSTVQYSTVVGGPPSKHYQKQ